MRAYRAARPKPGRWAVKDSNLRSRLTTDLQSVPFGRLGNRPRQSSSLLVCWSLSPFSKRLTDQKTNQPNCGADDENRTRNRPLTRRVLCRLSYVGMALACRLSARIIPKPFRPYKSNDKKPSDLLTKCIMAVTSRQTRRDSLSGIWRSVKLCSSDLGHRRPKKRAWYNSQAKTQTPTQVVIKLKEHF